MKIWLEALDYCCQRKNITSNMCSNCPKWPLFLEEPQFNPPRMLLSEAFSTTYVTVGSSGTGSAQVITRCPLILKIYIRISTTSCTQIKIGIFLQGTVILFFIAIFYLLVEIFCFSSTFYR